MVRRMTRDLIQVEVEFPECLSKPSLVKVVADLMKNLLHQRNQIPLQFDSINKDVKACEKAEEKENLPDGAEPSPGEAPSREAVRSSRQAARAAKNRAAYMKSGARLVREVEQVVDIIKTEVEKGDLTSISFMFGATPLSPREVFTIMIPQTTGCLQTNSRLGVHLFRAMVTHDQLHNLTTTRLPVSNMFTIFCRKTVPITCSLQMLPSYSLPPTTRCPRVNFTLSTPDKMYEDDFTGPTLATRRLRFCSGASSQNPSIPEASPNADVEHDVGTPDLQDGDCFSSPHKSDEMKNRSEMILRTSRKVAEMELCTPLVTRFSAPAWEMVTPSVDLKTKFREGLELCTPAGTEKTRLSDHMEMCTPAVNMRARVSDSMDLCTPAVNLRTKVSDSMELCTPAVNLRTKVSDPMELCTPAVILRTRVSDQMDLCTPAVSFRTRVELCTPGVVNSDIMQLCTPALGKFELDGDLDNVADNDLGKQELKDSGISSPVSSRGVSDEEFFWFVTPTPVRGFKH
jgi:hypothetical protein